LLLDNCFLRVLNLRVLNKFLTLLKSKTILRHS